jgi:hypothetical protein
MSPALPGAMVFWYLSREADVESKFAVDLMREHWSAC